MDRSDYLYCNKYDLDDNAIDFSQVVLDFDDMAECSIGEMTLTSTMNATPIKGMWSVETSSVKSLSHGRTAVGL